MIKPISGYPGQVLLISDINLETSDNIKVVTDTSEYLIMLMGSIDRTKTTNVTIKCPSTIRYVSAITNKDNHRFIVVDGDQKNIVEFHTNA